MAEDRQEEQVDWPGGGQVCRAVLDGEGQQGLGGGGRELEEEGGQACPYLWRKEGEEKRERTKEDSERGRTARQGTIVRIGMTGREREDRKGR